MNIKFCIAVLAVSASLMTGCGAISYPEMTDDAITFEMGTFKNPENDKDLFGTLEYNGRTYIAFGTVNNSFNDTYIDKCIGYIVNDEDPQDKNRRVYTLAGDADQNFLIDYDNTVKLMYQPDFWRAIDTKGKEIDIPGYIDDLGYDYWK